MAFIPQLNSKGRELKVMVDLSNYLAPLFEGR